jgi:hypothetical protein
MFDHSEKAARAALLEAVGALSAILLRRGCDVGARALQGCVAELSDPLPRQDVVVALCGYLQRLVDEFAAGGTPVQPGGMLALSVSLSPAAAAQDLVEVALTVLARVVGCARAAGLYAAALGLGPQPGGWLVRVVDAAVAPVLAPALAFRPRVRVRALELLQAVLPGPLDLGDVVETHALEVCVCPAGVVCVSLTDVCKKAAEAFAQSERTLAAAVSGDVFRSMSVLLHMRFADARGRCV